MAQRASKHTLTEEVTQETQSARGFDARSHLQKTHLVEAASEEIHSLVILPTSISHTFIEFLCLLEVRSLVMLDIHVGSNCLFKTGAHDASGA